MRIDLSRLGAHLRVVAGALTLAALAASGAAAQTAGRAVYVSPTGSDANTGLSPDQPFQTLEHARDVMRASAIKTAYLEGGLYVRTAPLELTKADAGESWLGFHGQTPVLDGGGTVKDGIVDNALNVTIRWLTIQNFGEAGILARGGGAVFDSNTITNIHSTAWTQGGIVGGGNFTNVRITHNLIRQGQYDGIFVYAAKGDNISGLLIQDNAVYDTCTVVADCGAIHGSDRGHASTNIRIDHNVIGRYGSDKLWSKGVYMDDLLSNTVVTNNIIYGNGQYGIQIHGGDHNLIQNNILDVRQATGAVLYQPSNPPLQMEANVFRCNIVLSAPVAPAQLWRKSGQVTPATEDNDLYWTAEGRAGGRGLGRFVDADGRDYTLRTDEAARACGFKPISAAGIGPLPNP